MGDTPYCNENKIMMLRPPPKPPTISIPPSYSCLFEHAEQMLSAWLSGKERESEAEVRVAVIQAQVQASQISVKTLKRVHQSQVFQRKVRLGRMLQLELVDAMDRIAVKPANRGMSLLELETNEAAPANKAPCLL